MALAREPFTFEALTRCQTPGCEWQVTLPRHRCKAHGEPDPSYEYWEATSGEVIVHGFDEQLRECE